MMLLVLHGPKLEVIACLILSSITLVLVFTRGTLEMALHWLTFAWAFAVDIIAACIPAAATSTVIPIAVATATPTGVWT